MGRGRGGLMLRADGRRRAIRSVVGGRRWGLALLGMALFAGPSRGAEPADARALLRGGSYAECIDTCRAAIAAGALAEEWPLLKIQAELAVGRYSDARQTYDAALARQSQSVQLLLLGRRVLQRNDQPGEADRVPAAIIEAVSEAPWRYGGAADRVAFGQALLLRGEDARRVLEQLYDRAKQADPKALAPFLASGALALEKNDFAVAAEAFEAAARIAPDEPDAFLGLARSYDSDAKRATAALNRALSLNPRHVDSLLLQADNLIDREAYADADVVLKQVLDINPKESRAWAYRAALAHLAGDFGLEKSARETALSTWRTDPQVDHLIGLKLSQKYRFAEGRAYQQQALAMDAHFQPAKVQLCQDLLRLGEAERGWTLAAEVLKTDPFNVLAFNLSTLHDQLATYRTLQRGQLSVLMEPREAELYGRRVVDLLTRARTRLAEKYGVDQSDTVFIEIFPRQKDFAIRTFGLPGGAGYLGVCFGNVITVNSPASRPARPANWEAVLWHELCHAITLKKTRNKMPRWLSEGISVHEEGLENRTWGQSMNPQYRQIILAGQATPVSRLSGAFMQPEGPLQLQFAYFESSMVVRYIVDTFGDSALRQVLEDLGRDVKINDALARATLPIDKLDAAFAQWLGDQARALAGGADLSRKDVPLEGDSRGVAEWNRQHPQNVWGLIAEGQALLAERKWQEALGPLQQAATLYPTYAQADSPHVLMAAAYRELKDAKSERAMLQRHAELSADAVEPRLRLLELAATDQDWPAVKAVAEQVLAINPLRPPPHRYLAQAAEKLGDRSAAIEARRALLLLDPLDLSGQHYHLAKLLADDRQSAAARREVLKSLEETPRYGAAQRLLLDLVKTEAPSSTPTTGPAPPPAGREGAR